MAVKMQKVGVIRGKVRGGGGGGGGGGGAGVLPYESDRGAYCLA